MGIWSRPLPQSIHRRLDIFQIGRIPGIRGEFFCLELLLAALSAVFHLLNLSDADRAEVARNFDIESRHVGTAGHP